jgi:hypothetical protein
MGQLSAKLRSVEGGFGHWCPACEEMHVFSVGAPNTSGAKWSFDGNVASPTFAPSMNIRTGPRPTVPVGRPDAGKIDVCHYFLKAGRDEYCGDCTHALRAQTVPLPDLPLHLTDRHIGQPAAAVPIAVTPPKSAEAPAPEWTPEWMRARALAEK